MLDKLHNYKLYDELQSFENIKHISNCVGG